FDHGADTGFKLTGSHATAGCGACHEKRPRYMGEPTTCVGCHEDVHKGELGTSCERCHDTTAFKPPSLFDHGKTKFPLENEHTKVPCASCHKRDSGGVVKYDVQGFERCSTCHGDPHRGRTSLSPCTDCHTTKGWHEVSNIPPAHSPAGWPLVGKHAGVDCTDCHGAAMTAKVSRACNTCHEDAHQGRFGARCESCHDESGWKHVNTAGFDHSKTRYPLEGQHRSVRCEQCHRQGGRNVYKGIAFDRCDRCHKPYHPAGELATAPSATTCESCHTVQGFDPSTFGLAEHDKARFHLDGSHLAVPCEQCHVRETTKKGGLGPTPLAIGVKVCKDCHADVHKGQFDAQMTGGKSCDACHTTTAWKAGDTFDHDKTAFPLRGVHADAACESCHKRPATPPGAPPAPIQYKGLPTTCEGCHRDPHLAQFTTAPNPKTCTTCHDERTWKQEPFDHAGLAGWPLEGHHAAQTCEACHDSRTLASGVNVVHYRLGYRACADCHANPHRAVGAKVTGARHPDVPDIGGDCESCHNASDWRQVAATATAFDHSLTGFPLDGRHKTAACTACHGPGLKTDEARAACESCHTDVHRGENGKSCESCHDARSWRPTDALLRHRKTRFPLVGAHAAADCTACHQLGREETWRSTPTECFACHAGLYRRPDIHPNHVDARFSHECDSCHSQYSFTPARLQHDVFFPLRGSHEAADCFSCHQNGVYGGTPKQCYACHADDYNGAIDPPHASYAMSRQCESCHNDVAWQPTRANWHDHVFKISSGHHAGFTCADCHFGQTLPPANFTCIGCHERGPTSGRHDGVTDFVYENFACYGCHQGGGG
ncbi:MAG: hypothetical protein KC635_27560, partial [Myxococcales bacterium]|nr:hypothetical protein [Myxococcales bacterium]